MRTIWSLLKFFTHPTSQELFFKPYLIIYPQVKSRLFFYFPMGAADYAEQTESSVCKPILVFSFSTIDYSSAEIRFLS